MGDPPIKKVYGLGDQVESFCLKSGNICIVEGKVIRRLIKEQNYVMKEPNNIKRIYPGYIAWGLNTEVFVELKPTGIHEIRKLIPK